ncbi:hypothetical protein [Pseudomonas subflava]|nr:hypothetical protein [Pseudomonas subflava]HSX70368.1 hypothetical protein [Pseudomonas sp.]
MSRPTEPKDKTPQTHEPPAENEQPDEDIPGEQPRSRSNEGDPLNAPN